MKYDFKYRWIKLRIMEVHVGCCGFPMAMKKYFEKFSAVEVQSTFYRFPSPKVVENWRAAAPKGFIFCIKAFQGISHPTTSPTWRRSGLSEEEIKNLGEKVGYLRSTKEVFEFWNKTLEIAKSLGTRACLIQLSSSFKCSPGNIKNVEGFFKKAKRNGILIALELRGWPQENFREVCKRFDLISVVDPFKEPPVWFSKSKVAYFRLHGAPPGKRMYNYKYMEKDLKWLAERVQELKDCREVYCFFNNISMAEDALRFERLIARCL